MSKKVFRVHTIESVFVGPTQPETTFPPTDTLTFPERRAEWSFEELANGDIVVTHRNPRAKKLEIDGKKTETPLGQVWSTRIGAGNLRDVQYEFEPIAAPAAAKPLKGAA